MNRVALLIASVFYLGRCPLAPGTAGTFAGLVIYALMAGITWQAYCVITVALFVLGVWASTVAEEELGRKDPSQVVIDEVVGYLVTMIGISISFKRCSSRSRSTFVK